MTYSSLLVEGCTSSGEYEAITLRIVDNPEYESDPNGEHRYHVEHVDADGDVVDYAGFDSMDEAAAYVEQGDRDFRDLYNDQLTEARDALSDALIDATAEWADLPEREAVLALSSAIMHGKAAEVLAVLQAAGLAD